MTTANLHPGRWTASWRTLSFACFALVTLLAGCGQNEKMRQRVAEDEASAKQYVDQLRSGKFDEIEHDADPGVFPVDGHQTLVSMAAMFPAQQPLSVKVVGANAYQGTDFYNASVDLEYEFPQQWVVVHVSTHETGDTAWITEFQVQQRSQSIENTNRFTLAGKSGSQYTILILAVSSFLLSLYAFVLCLRTKGTKRKWLWSIATLIGIGRLVVNWTSGELTLAPLWVTFPSGNAGSAAYGPWFVYVSLPLGAILFLSLHKQLAQSLRTQ